MYINDLPPHACPEVRVQMHADYNVLYMYMEHQKQQWHPNLQMLWLKLETG